MDPVLLTAVAAVTIGAFGVLWVFASGGAATQRQVSVNLQRGLQAPAPTGGGARRRSSAGTIAERVLPSQARGYIEKLLVSAGRPPAWPIERVVAAKFLLMALGGLVGFLLISTVHNFAAMAMMLFLVVLGFFFPELRLYSMGIERRQAIGLELPDTLDQMSIAVQAGLGFDAAMLRVARNGKGSLAEEMIRTMQDVQIGQPRRAAYSELGERCGVPELRRFMRSIVQAETYGLAVSEVLHTQANEMRLQRRQRAEAKAMEIPVKVVFPLILCILPVIFIVLIGPAGIRIFNAFSHMG